MTIVNSFGYVTDPIHFKRNLPRRLWSPFQDAISKIAEALSLNAELTGRLSVEWLEAVSKANDDEQSLIDRMRLSLRNLTPWCDRVYGILEARSELICSQILPYILDGDVLDWGCGDGLVSKWLTRTGLTVQLLDIDDRRLALRRRELIRYDEAQLPKGLKVGGARSLLLLTVLHHAKNPGRTLRHVSILRPDRIIVIESTPELRHPAFEDNCHWAEIAHARYEYCGFVDWIYNRVICTDVQVTFNYLHSRTWIQMFEVAGYCLTKRVELGVDQAIVPEWHTLLILDLVRT